jgi:hypothetical protein
LIVPSVGIWHCQFPLQALRLIHFHRQPPAK